MKIVRLFICALSVAFVFAGGGLCWADDVDQFKGLDEQIQDIKADVLDISAQLSELEERLLFPSHSQATIFLSLVDDFEFRLDSIDIDIDGQVAARHLYSFKELDALQTGGTQRLFTGNLTTGTHACAVTYRGKDKAGDMVEKSASIDLVKSTGPVFFELIMSSDGLTLAGR